MPQSIPSFEFSDQPVLRLSLLLFWFGLFLFQAIFILSDERAQLWIVILLTI
jgi:hypothetical protein